MAVTTYVMRRAQAKLDRTSRSARGNETRARVAVPIPSSTDAITGLEHLHREAKVARAIELIHARQAGANDDDVRIHVSSWEIGHVPIIYFRRHSVGNNMTDSLIMALARRELYHRADALGSARKLARMRVRFAQLCQTELI